MTPKQHRWYLREWGLAFRRHWAGTRGGEALARPGRPPSPMRDHIVALAGQIAARLPDGRLSAEVLRHACHVAALGRDVSSLKLTNKQLDLVVALFRRLAEDGQELAGQIRLDARDREIDRQLTAAGDYQAGCGEPPPWREVHPDADRKRVLWSLEHSGYPEAAIARICEDTYGTRSWRSLPDRDLYQLLLTIKRAAPRRAAKALEAGVPVAAAAAPTP